jgi:hypothetical protein
VFICELAVGSATLMMPANIAALEAAAAEAFKRR